MLKGAELLLVEGIFMFFIQSHITIETDLSLPDIAKEISRALNIPDMVIDQSGRYEDVPVYLSTCFGLVFDVGRIDEDPPLTYQLDISSDIDAFDFDGLEKEIDATKYVLLLLRRAGIKASPRDPKLLY